MGHNLEHDPEIFFRGRIVTTDQYDRSAALKICAIAAERGILIGMIEGGIKHGPAFEARYDAIWKGIDFPATEEEVEKNNREAREFILSVDPSYDAFIFTGFSKERWKK